MKLRYGFYLEMYNQSFIILYSGTQKFGKTLVIVVLSKEHSYNVTLECVLNPITPFVLEKRLCQEENGIVHGIIASSVVCWSILTEHGVGTVLMHTARITRTM